MPWYTWVFSGVGAAIVVPVVGWSLGLFRRPPRQQAPPASPAIPDGTATSAAPVSAAPVGAAPVGQGAARTPTAASGVTQVSAAGKNQQNPTSLIDCLVTVPEITDPAFRQLLYAHLPSQVAQQLKMGGSARIELLSLIDTFTHFPQLRPWQAFHDRLGELLPASPAVERLGDQLADLGYIDRP